MHLAKEFIRTACSTRATVAWCEIVAKDVRPRNVILLKQPANERGGSDSLRGRERIRFTANVFDADRVLVCTHTMIRTIAVAHHLIDVAVSIDDVMR